MQQQAHRRLEFQQALGPRAASCDRLHTKTFIRPLPSLLRAGRCTHAAPNPQLPVTAAAPQLTAAATAAAALAALALDRASASLARCEGECSAQ